VKCAVLGDPVAHSLSPTLHQAAYAELEMSDWSYTSTRVAAGGLASYVASLGGDWPPGRWRGLSVTMPLKREAFELARSVSPRARLTGAVNTLVRSSHGWAGDNTDLPGAVAAIREKAGAGFSCSHGAVLGAGATAASTGLALAELGASRITLLARNPGATGETIAMISRHRSKPVVSVLPLDSAVGGGGGGGAPRPPPPGGPPRGGAPRPRGPPPPGGARRPPRGGRRRSVGRPAQGACARRAAIAPQPGQPRDDSRRCGWHRHR
jgi:shikimate dehydrogenase